MLSSVLSPTAIRSAAGHASGALRTGWRSSRRRATRRAALTALTAAVLLLVPAAAFAAEPVLEYVVPGGHPPVPFTSEGGALTAQMAGFETLVQCAASRGEGEITGPRWSTSKYSLTGCVTEGGTDAGAKCKSEGASEEEIRTGPIEAVLVYISQARGEVGELLNPAGGNYLVFECGGVSAEARGPFLSTIAPVNTEAGTFTATLSESGGLQSPDEYENPLGEARLAIPEGRRASGEWVTTGVLSGITVHPAVAVTIRAVSGHEIEAREHGAEAILEGELRREEEALAAALTKRHFEEEAAAAVLAKDREQAQAEAAAAARELHEAQAAAATHRARLLAKALRLCRKDARRRRARCEAAARKKYGSTAKNRI